MLVRFDEILFFGWHICQMYNQYPFNNQTGRQDRYWESIVWQDGFGKKIYRLALLPIGAFYIQLDSNPDSDSKQLDSDSDPDSRKKRGGFGFNWIRIRGGWIRIRIRIRDAWIRTSLLPASRLIMKYLPSPLKRLWRVVWLAELPSCRLSAL